MGNGTVEGPQPRLDTTMRDYILTSSRPGDTDAVVSAYRRDHPEVSADAARDRYSGTLEYMRQHNELVNFGSSQPLAIAPQFAQEATLARARLAATFGMGGTMGPPLADPPQLTIQIGQTTFAGQSTGGVAGAFTDIRVGRDPSWGADVIPSRWMPLPGVTVQGYPVYARTGSSIFAAYRANGNSVDATEVQPRRGADTAVNRFVGNTINSTATRSSGLAPTSGRVRVEYDIVDGVIRNARVADNNLSGIDNSTIEGGLNGRRLPSSTMGISGHRSMTYVFQGGS